MKKFLSSLLALTMILSLVIVPANAAAGDYTVTGLALNAKLADTDNAENAPTTVANGTTVYFSIDDTHVEVKNGQDEVTDATASYQWKKGSESVGTDAKKYSVELSTDQPSATVTVTCDVTYTKGDKSGTHQTLSKTFTVTNAQKAFEAAAKTVTYQGRTYTVPTGATPSVTIDTFDDEAIDNLTAKVGGTTTTITKTATNTFTLKSVDNAYSVTLTTTPSKVTGQALASLALALRPVAIITLLPSTLARALN